MGNCIHLFFCRPHDNVHALFDGGEEEFDASTPVKKITSSPSNGERQPRSSFLPNAMLEPEGVYYMVPDVEHPQSPSMLTEPSDQECKSNFVKIMVTKRELASILRDGDKMAPEEIAVQLLKRFCFNEQCQKWRPSLATIPEVQNC
ncbi:hypothetical protein NL676_007638 [Syzygium grande]|nr:hypothetical protein NL676_007638 [Syzygium grande]